MMNKPLHFLLPLLLLSHLSIQPLFALPSFFPNITNNLPNITSSNPWDIFTNFTGCHVGDTRDGLSKLKQYFHRFGYIPDSFTNFTDEFDNSLESALKTYQLNFNLNTTGTLDESTLNQMVRPRCGVPDIINGSSTMNSGTQPSPSSFHSVAHFTFFPGRPRWPQSKRDLTYAFFPGNQLTDTVKTVFERAFTRWSAVTPLKFRETQLFGTADITIGFFSGDHGDGEPFDGVLGTLAHAFSPPNGRFHLDGDENWVVEGDVSTSRLAAAIDLESVAVHEIGHLLGLGHSSVEDAIMFPTITSGMKKVELANDDVEGIQTLYGGNPNFNGTESANTLPRQERETNGSGTHRAGRVRWSLGVVVVAALLLVFRL